MNGQNDMIEECARVLAEAGLEKATLEGRVAELEADLRREREGYEDGRRAVADAVTAVLEAMAAPTAGRAEGDALCNLLWWLVMVGRRHPARVRVLHGVRTVLGGVVRRGAAVELAGALGMPERSVRRHLAALREDRILRGTVVWCGKDGK